jgi:glycosyltransferase involved in cell wall biosynthesis
MTIEVVIPVYNEEAQLPQGVAALARLLAQSKEHEVTMLIADNGSTDRTFALAQRLSQEYPSVQAVHFDQKGRGGALKAVWFASEAEIVSYMDVDLSTDLVAFPKLCRALASGDFDLAVGSRLMAGAKTIRCLRRELISRGYNRLLKAVFHTRFSDAQCGFKAMTRQAAQELLPLVTDTHWFFDTELLVLAEKLGYRICDIPVHWVENRDSRVKIVPTILQDLKGILRLHRKLKRGDYEKHRIANHGRHGTHGKP